MEPRRVPDSAGRERMWQLLFTLTGVVGALIAKRLLRLLFQAIRKDSHADSPFDPTSARFSWPAALSWALAAGIGLGVAKVVSARVAVFSWERATGTRPPGAGDEQTAAGPSIDSL